MLRQGRLPPWCVSTSLAGKPEQRRRSETSAYRLVVAYHNLGAGYVPVVPFDLLVVLALEIFLNAFLTVPFGAGDVFARIVLAPQQLFRKAARLSDHDRRALFLPVTLGLGGHFRGEGRMD